MAELAESLAVRAHAGQMDQAGRPYIEHQERVAAAVRGNPEAEAVAWLHETLEHTDLTPDVMRQYGISETVVTAVTTLTRWRNQSTAQYLQGVRANSLALVAKIADMDDNTSPAQLERMDPEKRARMVGQYVEYLVAFTGGSVSGSGQKRAEQFHSADMRGPAAEAAGASMAASEGRARHRGGDADVPAGSKQGDDQVTGRSGAYQPGARDDSYPGDAAVGAPHDAARGGSYQGDAAPGGGYRGDAGQRGRQAAGAQHSASLPGRTQLGGGRGSQQGTAQPSEVGHPTGLAHPGAYRHSSRVPSAQQVRDHGAVKQTRSTDGEARHGAEQGQATSRSALRRGVQTADAAQPQDPAAGRGTREPANSGYVGYGPQAAAARAYEYGDATGEAPAAENRGYQRPGRGYVR